MKTYLTKSGSEEVLKELNVGPVNVPQKDDVLTFSPQERYRVIYRELFVNEDGGVKKLRLVVINADEHS